MNSPLSHAAIAAFVTSGKATFTVVGKEARFTFKVVAPKVDRATGEKIVPESSGVRFVSVLTGPDNTSHYSKLGTVFPDGTYVYNRNKAQVGKDAPSAKAAEWFFSRVKQNTIPPALEVWHHGKCARCGRKLTVPSSLATGLGPECEAKVNG